MIEFKYRAVDRQGKEVNGIRKAEARDAVALWLQQQGLVVITVQENLSAEFKKIFSTQVGGAPLADRVIFAKQLSTMLSASLPILQALEILVQQTKNAKLKEQLQTVYNAVESGSSISDAFSREKSMFNDLQISLLRAGEKSGNLNVMMERIAIDMEKTKKLRSRIINALIYPVIIFIVMIGVFLLLVIFMVPAVSGLYKDFGITELPAVTQALIALSQIMSNPLGILGIIFFAVSSFIGFRYYYNSYIGRRRIDKFTLNMPIFGSLNTKIQLTQFCRLLAMLLQSGVPIVEALRTIADSMSNSLFSDVIKYSAAEVTKGSSVTVPLARGNIFPPVLLKILATGEQTGKLDQIAADMGAYYEQEVDDTTANLTKLIEPLILLFVGGLVALIAVAIYLPIYSLGSYLQ